MLKTTVDSFGTKRYNLYGELHREDGPAAEYANGDKYWFINGKRHREDGPAIEKINGDKYWFINGKRHREDGPAVEYSDGTSFWYLNNIGYSKEAWLEMLPEDLRIKALFNESFING